MSACGCVEQDTEASKELIIIKIRATLREVNWSSRPPSPENILGYIRRQTLDLSDSKEQTVPFKRKR